MRCFFSLLTAQRCTVCERSSTMSHDAICFSTNSDTTFCIAWFVPEIQIKAFQSVWVSLWRQCREFGKSLVSLMVFTKVLQLVKFTLSVLISKYLPNRWWDQDHDWQRSLKVNEGFSQVHESIWVFYQADSAWKHSVFLIQDAQGPTALCTMPHKQENPHMAVRQFHRPDHPWYVAI